MKSLQEATIAARAELEEARKDQARSSEIMEDLVRSTAVSEQGRQEAMVDLDCMRRALDTETIKSTRWRAQREDLVREKTLLL